MSVIQDKGLGSKSISRLMLRFCIPCIISLLVGALYNLLTSFLSPIRQILDPVAMLPALSSFR